MTGIKQNSKDGKNSKKKITHNAKKKAALVEMGADIPQDKLKRYQRGTSVQTKGVKDKKLKRNLKQMEEGAKHGAIRAAKWDLLLQEEKGYLEAEDMERTFKFTQKQIKENVDQQTQKKIFDLNLDTFGPYRVNYSRNGRDLLIAGRKGHVAAFDWSKGKLACEMHLKETVRDITWLHNETLFAVAQKKYAYIYDNTGTEIHILRKHVEPQKLAFLPYHFLLTSVGNNGFLKYQDVSTGGLVCEHRTGLGNCNVMKANPYNAVMCLGHNNGSVTMWTPNITKPVVKMLCHRGPVTSIAIDNRGLYLATSGLDGQMKIWDIRTYKLLHEYFTRTPASHLDISQSGLLGVSYGPHVQIWKDPFTTKQKSPYLTQLYGGKTIENIQFVPYEDVLGVGHQKGVSSMVVPGAGDANFDALELNPYQTTKQRQQKEVRSLLEKIQPELITLDPHNISRMDRAHSDVIAHEKKKQFEANNPKVKFEPKYKKRGKSSASRKYLRKQINVIDEKKTLLREKLEDDRKKREQDQKSSKNGGSGAKTETSVLDRFS